MNTPIEIVETFVAHYNAGEYDAAIDLLAEDLFYHNIPMEPIIGRKAFRQFNDATVVNPGLRAAWIITGIAANEDLVLTERVDDFISPAGGRVSVPLMGSFVIRDGKIAEWRDYFDLADFQRQFEALSSEN